MKKQRKTIYLLIALALISLSLASLLAQRAEQAKQEADLPVVSITEAMYRSERFISLIENRTEETGRAIDYESAAYRYICDDFLLRSARKMTLEQLCRHYMSLIDRLSGEGCLDGIYYDDAFLDLPFVWGSNGLMINPCASFPDGAKVLAIDGWKITDFERTIDAVFPSTTAAQKNHYRAWMIPRRFLHNFVGAGYENQAVLTLQIKNEEVAYPCTYSHFREMRPPSDIGVSLNVNRNANYLSLYSYHISDEMFSDLERSFLMLKQDGVDTLIVDVRQNNGGNAAIAAELIALIKKCELDICLVVTEDSFISSFDLVLAINQQRLGRIIGREPPMPLKHYRNEDVSPRTQHPFQVARSTWIDFMIPYGTDPLDAAFQMMEKTYVTQPLDHSLRREYDSSDSTAAAQELIRFTEETHPIFLNHPRIPLKLESDYETAKDNLLRTSSTRMSGEMFLLLGSRYLKTLKDGHSYLNTSSSTSMCWLDISLRWSEEGLFINPTAEVPHRVKLLEIDGMNVEEIGAFIDSFSSYENEAARYYQRIRFVKNDYLHRWLGLPPANERKLLVEEDGIQRIETVPYSNHRNYANLPVQAAFEFQLIEDGKAAYIVSRVCQHGKAHEDTLSALEEALRNGVKTVIFDVTNNSGGLSSIWTPFFELLGLHANSYGRVFRLSPQTKERFPYDIRDTLTREPVLARNDHTEYRIIVLVDQPSFSSAVTLATFIHDSQGGIVIGREPRNTPSAFGDSVHFTLPWMNIDGEMSISYLLRPDPEQGSTLVDITVPFSANILDEALHLVRQP